MSRVVEASVDETGRVVLLEPIAVKGRSRALVILLDEPPRDSGLESTGDPSATTALYRILRPLGEGGMGITYQAQHVVTGRVVCLKALRPGLRAGLLRHEWTSLERVTSRYVARLLETWEDGPTSYIVMEYVDGGTLTARGPGLSGEELLWLGACLFEGAAAMHRLGVVHCDLKPDNVLIQDLTVREPGEPGWIPKIVDLGLALLDDRDADSRVTGEGRFAGTPAYMAPEQIRGERLTPACDVYALGQLLWELFAGRRAFHGPTGSVIAEKLARRDGLQPVEAPLHPAPEEVWSVLGRCTDPDAGRRPSAEEASQAFRQHL